MDATGVTVKLQSQAFKVARFCVRKQVEERDVGAVKWNPALSHSRSTVELPWEDLNLGANRKKMEVEKDGEG